MAGGGRRVVIEFLGKDTSLGRTAGQVEGKTSKLGKRLATIGKVAAVGFAGGAIVAGKALYDMGKAAAEDEAAQKRLATTLKNTTGANSKQVAGVEDWITAQGKALGVTDDELRPALGRLATATGDVGKAQKLASLAMDISAGTGKSLEAVSTALAKAQTGNVGGLSRLGIATKDASGKTKTFAALQGELAKKFKGQSAVAANTFQGKMGRLKLMFDETKETIGAKLLPIVERLGTWFMNTGLPAIQRFSGFLRDKLGPTFQKIKELAAKFLTIMRGDFKKNFTQIKVIFVSVVSIIRSLWNRFGATLVKYIRTSLNNARTIIKGVLNVIAGIFRTFAALLRGDWKGVWEGIKQIVRGAWQAIRGIVAQGWNVIKTLFRLAGSAIRGILGGIWSGLRSLVSNGMHSIIDVIRSIPGRIRALGSSFGSAGKSLIDALLHGIANAGSFVSDIAGNIWGAVKGLLNSGIDRINSALEFTIHGPGPLPDVTVNPPNIPHLARGGVVRARTGGTLALLGEAGADEAVIPLSGRHAPKLGGNGDVASFRIDLNLDAKTVQTVLLKLKRTNGGLELGLA